MSEQAQTHSSQTQNHQEVQLPPTPDLEETTHLPIATTTTNKSPTHKLNTTPIEITRQTSPLQVEHLKKAREAKKRLREQRIDVLSQTSEGISKVHNDITNVVSDIAEIRDKVSQLHSYANKSSAAIFAIDNEDESEATVQPKSKKPKTTASGDNILWFGKVSSLIAAAISLVYGIWSVVDYKSGHDNTPLPWAEREYLTTTSKSPRELHFDIV